MSDFVYLIDLTLVLGEDELKSKKYCRCSLSNKNILAFSNDCNIYLVAAEKPNELVPIQAASSQSECICLAWSEDANFLLAFYKNGQVNIFNFKTNLLNSMDYFYSFHIDKNDVAMVRSFSKSPKLCFNAEKFESLNYFEKYCYQPFKSLRNYSKLQYSGFLLLTKGGILHICITDYNSVKNRSEKFEYNMNLTNTITKIDENNTDVEFEFGDFSLETDGNIHVIFSNSDISTPIYILKVNLRFSIDSTSVEGTSELLTSFQISSKQYSNPAWKKTNVLFTSSESAQTVCVCLRSTEGKDVVQIWQVAALNPNSFIDISKEPVLLKEVQCPSALVELSVPKSSLEYRDFVGQGIDSMRNGNEAANFVSPLYISLAYQNGTFGFISINDLSSGVSTTSPIPTRVNYESPMKKCRLAQEYSLVMEQSHSGSILIGITNLGRLVLVRQTTKTDPTQLFNMYEYAMLTGHDYWDLLINTPSKTAETLIQMIEERLSSVQPTSLQKIYNTKFRCLLYSLSKLVNQSTSQSGGKFRGMEELSRLAMSKAMSVLSFAIQLVPNIEQISDNLLNKTNQQPAINMGLLALDSSFQSSLSDLVTELLNEKKLNSLSEILSVIVSGPKRPYTVSVNQQVRHILQWILDLSLYLTRIAPLSRLNHSSSSNTKSRGHLFGFGLLFDLGFLNEIRKAIVYMKLIFNQPNVNFPILPLRSSVQKDLLSDLFNVYSKIILKITEGENILNDEGIMDLCLNLEAETIIRPVDEFFYNFVNYVWFNSQSAKPLQMSVDELFESEKQQRQIYPIFDIIRLIQFSRSSITKQCIRCGNFTEAQMNIKGAQPIKNNCIYMQDSTSDKCVCGGCWVISPLQSI